uniref:Mitochondrial 3-ketoacyl-coa thiolase n=1 Tax=Ditylenchus dipsaci TaxID=166011 RepID=A0A915E9V9_9BILA
MCYIFGKTCWSTNQNPGSRTSCGCQQTLWLGFSVNYQCFAANYLWRFQCSLAGGTEAMSQAPYLVRNMRFGAPLGVNIEFEDSLWSSGVDLHAKMPMGITAENLGEKYQITREESDEYALKSQTRWRLANNAGYFKGEIEPIHIKSKKGEVIFEMDQHPRETTLEELGKLKAVFKKDGLVTPGNASGVCDGAAAVVVASQESVEKLHLTPLARIVGWYVVGCDPTIMGIGPVEAIKGLCHKTGVSIDKIDVFDINEAFACQTLAVQKELNLENDRLNVNGGAIAMGHPLGASGARITAHLAHEIQRRGIQYAVGAACIGGGQGIAILLEKV